MGPRGPAPAQTPLLAAVPWVFFLGWSLQQDPGPRSFGWEVQQRAWHFQWAGVPGRGDAEHLTATMGLCRSSPPAVLPTHMTVLPFFNCSITTLNSCYYHSPRAPDSRPHWLCTQADSGVLPCPTCLCSCLPHPGVPHGARCLSGQKKQASGAGDHRNQLGPG